MKIKVLICLLALITLAGCATISHDVASTVKPQKIEGEYVSVEEAKMAAVSHQNINIETVSFNKAEFSDEKHIYDIEFITHDACYNYLIDASSNEVLSFNIQSTAVERITEAKAKEIALSHVNVKSSDADFVKTELDYEDGIEVYELEFYITNKKCDYKIHSKTGQIISYSHENCDCLFGEHHHGTNNNNDDKQTTNVKPTTKITKAQAKEIALKHAKVKASAISKYEIELDYDNGKAIYEIEFKVGKKEYEYEIDATSGKIISHDVSHDEGHHNGHH